jgi:hypothetical protein
MGIWVDDLTVTLDQGGGNDNYLPTLSYDPNMLTTYNENDYLNYGAPHMAYYSGDSYDGMSHSSMDSGDGFTVQDAAQWLKLGLITYAQFQDVQHGNYAAYTGQALRKPNGELITGPDDVPQNGPDTQVPGDSSSNQTPFDWHALFDPSKPWVYIGGVAVVGGVWLLIHQHRGRR